MHANAPSIGVDFGTTNTVVAIATPDGAVETLRFDHAEFGGSIFMSALCFWEERVAGVLHGRMEGGPWAIEQFLTSTSPHRFIQSFKSFAASAAFQETRIFRQRFAFEDLLAAFLRTLARHAKGRFDPSTARLTVGRPVAFVGGRPDDALAMSRYRAGLQGFGAADAGFAYEPVGAAFSFARRLDHDATVLVADFGGGTSDFSVMRFTRKDGRLAATALGHAGVGIAGDAFDYRMIDHVVSPRLGKGGRYRSFGKTLPIPSHYFVNFARWHQLALMKGSGELKELRELARSAVEPGPLEDFITLVEDDLGFALYRAVSQAKMALSDHDTCDFRFAASGVEIVQTVTRADFEHWIADDVARIGRTVDEALARAGIATGAIDRVFLTGGTSFVPAIRRLFSDRFGEERLIAAEQFESIANGLALIGQAEEPDQWLWKATE
jgi:hypothetical chaperone protein